MPSIPSYRRRPISTPLPHRSGEVVDTGLRRYDGMDADRTSDDAVISQRTHSGADTHKWTEQVRGSWGKGYQPMHNSPNAPRFRATPLRFRAVLVGSGQWQPKPHHC